MYNIVPTGKFKKDLKIVVKRGYDTRLIDDVVTKLANGEVLEPKYKEYLLCDMIAIYDCDAIFMCREWYDSKGCFAELAFAKAIGLEILYQPE